jgi:hypothetical protein
MNIDNLWALMRRKCRLVSGVELRIFGLCLMCCSPLAIKTEDFDYWTLLLLMSGMVFYVWGLVEKWKSEGKNNPNTLSVAALTTILIAFLCWIYVLFCYAI